MVNAYRPITTPQRYVEVYAREGDSTSHLICKIDFGAGVLIAHHRGDRFVVILDEAYRRWLEKYEQVVENSEGVLTGT